MRLNLSKFIFFLFFVVALHTTYYILRTTYVRADEKAVPEPFVPCTDEYQRDTDNQATAWKNPEYNSLRPYQASTSGDAPKTYFCNNDYVIEEEVTTKWDKKCGYPEMVCPHHEIIKRNYEIHINDVNLPILGNTQNVTNSTKIEDELDDAQKMNEYLTWYLSGTNQKPEYGNDTLNKTVSFSGPLKKLLPSVIQEWQRFGVLHKSGVKLEYEDNDDMEGSTRDTDLGKAGVQAEETYNHNQIVVCTDPAIKNTGFLGIDIYNQWFGKEVPIPCYKSPDAKSEGTSYRMLQWWEGKFAGYLESDKIIKNWSEFNVWGASIPPFPWQFTDEFYYRKAYKEWRGATCLIHNKKLNLLVCTKLPDTNRWVADFYQYVPLGTPADKKASHLITGVNISGQGQTKAERPKDANGNSMPDTYEVKQNPILYYPHTQSSFDMLKVLNELNTPDNLDGATKAKEGGAPPTQTDFEARGCELADVRIRNDGDDLTFDNKQVEDKQRAYVTGVQIEVTQIGCLNKAEIRDFVEVCGGVTNPNIRECRNEPSCDGIVNVVIKSTPKIPYADQIWAKSVTGQDSQFRKIFPKIENGAPVSCIADIPGVSKATYSPGEDTNLVAIDTPDGKKSPDSSEVYFPHLGTVYEYFLKGIQTALRPKGYGEPIVSGKLCATTVACGEWESKLKGSGGACGICNAPIGDLAKKILTAAGEAYQVPAANIWAAMKHEGADWNEFRGQFTDDNVRKWSNSVACGGEPMPSCDNNNEVTQPPFGFLSKWFYLGDGDNALWTAVQKIDPTRDTKEKVSRCNFLDSAFATAKLLRQGSSNTSTSAGASCGSYTFDATQPASCSNWTDTKIAQSQVGHMGQCPETSPYGPVPFTIADVVSWYKDAKCQ